MPARLEHANFTVSDPDATAAWMCKLFDWTVRWSGPAKNGGRSVHVGTPDLYVALFAPKGGANPATDDNYETIGGLNHIAVTVDDLDQTEADVIKHGFVTGNHADYEPGRRFYFHDDNGIEFEVVSYA